MFGDDLEFAFLCGGFGRRTFVYLEVKMYFCKKCNNPLTELDVYFYKGLFKTVDKENCKCVNCQAGYDAAQKMRKVNSPIPGLWLHIPSILSLIFFTITFGMPQLFESLPEPQGLLFYAIFGVMTIIVFAGVLVCPFFIVRQWYWKNDDNYDPAHIEISVNSSGDINAEKVDGHYYTTDNSLWLIICYITCLLWVLPHFFYIILKRAFEKAKLKVDYPSVAVDAYANAYAKAERLTNYNKDYKLYKSKKEAYDEQIKKTSSRYAVLGQHQV